MSYTIIDEEKFDRQKWHHANARSALDAWWQKATVASWTCYNDIKQTFNSADQTNSSDPNMHRIIFDIGGNNYRLICDISYKRKFLYIMAFWTHTVYDRRCKKNGGSLDGVYINAEKNK